MTDAAISRSEHACDPLSDPRVSAALATPARLFLGSAGTSYRTADLLRLRVDHALAKDALAAVVDVDHPALREVAGRWGLIDVATQARSHREYLLRPDLGRRLDADGVTRIRRTATRGADLQVVLGDGLSPEALAVSGPAVVAGLRAGAVGMGWSFATPVFVRRARVGVLNDIGVHTACRVAILLIGERPGLRTRRSLSAYLAFRPRAGDTDAERNLVCNISPHGVSVRAAVERITSLMADLVAAGASGFTVKERLGQADRAAGKPIRPGSGRTLRTGPEARPPRTEIEREAE
ncbi:Ethanolamine ammonia-lyase light chain [Frankia canadensis]|uniref:Ethanolamine ammonia-lyase small subunit n=1 Tax=Frankia canadensis TaxID=1836972 RepID=A0A2I2KSC1_9ACTN|nr:ethanolamine ammonia-lyase subunit EutC [Frankia canadensis]SNQ48567.1 Ethanolamine ammonia-lyase light chain [Frankia canadensis]SOU55857.1 Ethanolamine ammonia-lyase light chain [Frankia canadensis]